MCVEAGAVPGSYPVTVLSSSAVRTAEGCDGDQGRQQRSCGSRLFVVKGSSDIRYLIFLKMYSPPVMGLGIDLTSPKEELGFYPTWNAALQFHKKLSKKPCETQGLLRLFSFFCKLAHVSLKTSRLSCSCHR